MAWADHVGGQAQGAVVTDEAEAIKNLYWPEGDAGSATRNRSFPAYAARWGDIPLSAAEGAAPSVPNFQAARGPISFHGSGPDNLVRDLEDFAPEGSPSPPGWRRQVAEAVTAADSRVGISIEDPRVRRPVSDPREPVRYRMVPDCGNEHDVAGMEPLMCPWCTSMRLSTRNDELREENRDLTEAANRLLQIWSDFDTSSAPIPRHFRLRMENAAQRVRAARP